MNKKIIHFGQDLDKAEFYNLIVKVTDIGSSELSAEIRNELLSREFMIYYSDDDSIEANYKNKYWQVSQKFRELNVTGWHS